MTGDGNFLSPRGSPLALPASSETAALAIPSRESPDSGTRPVCPGTCISLSGDS